MYNLRITGVIFAIVLLCVILVGNEQRYDSRVLASDGKVKNTAELPSLVKETSLLKLNVKNFNKTYDKLPSTYKIKIGMDAATFNGLLTDKNGKSIKVTNSSRTITKKQAEKVYRIAWGTEDGEKFAISLKGLRFFRNLRKIYFDSSKVRGLSEMSYLEKLREVQFGQCDLGLDHSVKSIQCLKKMRLTTLEISGCRLENLDFLKGFQHLNNINLDFSNNKIEKINKGIHFGNVKLLSLSNNKITNISPLVMARKLIHLDLANNKIQDITPLKNCKKITELYLSNNKITSISLVEKFEKLKVLNLDYNDVVEIKALKNLKNLSHLGLTGNRIKDVSVLKNQRFEAIDKSGIYQDQFSAMDNCIVDYSPINSLLQTYYKSYKRFINNGTLFFEGMKHFDLNLNGKSFPEGKSFPSTFFLNKKDPKVVLPAWDIGLFFRGIDGTSTYQKNMGQLICTYQGKTFIFRDFSQYVLINGKNIRLSAPMRHMEGDRPFAIVSDLCKLTGKSYQIIKSREMLIPFSNDTDWKSSTVTVPSMIEIK